MSEERVFSVIEKMADYFKNDDDEVLTIVIDAVNAAYNVGKGDGTSAGLEAAAKLVETYLKTSEQMADRTHINHVTRGDLAAISHVQAEDIAADIRALKTSEARADGSERDCSVVPGQRSEEPGSPSGEANRYHQALGAKWMCEAIVKWLRTPLPGTLCEDQERDERIADSLVRRWEDKSFWRPRSNAEPAGGERGAGVCKRCGGGGTTEVDRITPWKTNPCPRCGGTGKEPEVK
jgi:hypothetical protein